MRINDYDWGRIRALTSLTNFVSNYANKYLTDIEEWKYVIDSLELYGGLKSLLGNLYDNVDIRFLEKYKETFSDMITFEGKKLSQEKSVDTFNKVYLFLEAYRYNNDDFDNFNMIVDDILVTDYKSNIIFDRSRTMMIEKVISNKYFKDLPELSRFFKEVCLNSSDEDFYNAFLYYKSMFKMTDSIVRNGVDEEKLALVNNIICFGLDNYCEENNCVEFDLDYKDILLKGCRMAYFNNKLKEVEPNVYIRKDIFSRISSLNSKMFDDMGNDDDYLLNKLDIVFDSDTYMELTAKLDVLTNASSLYESGKIKEAYEVLFVLDKVHKKKHSSGFVVEKPNTIVERMAKIYSGFDSDKDEKFIIDVHSNAKSIEEFYLGLGVLDKKNYKRLMIIKKDI